MMVGWMFGVLPSLFALPTAGATFEATLDRNQISLGDTAILTLTISGGTVSSDPTVPPIAGIDIRGTGTQTEVNIDGFHMVRKSIFTVELTPTTTGNFIIPPIQVGVDGETLSSKPLRLSVAKGQAASAPGTGPAFVQLARAQDQSLFWRSHAGGNQMLLPGRRPHAAAHAQQ